MASGRPLCAPNPEYKGEWKPKVSTVASSQARAVLDTESGRAAMLLHQRTVEEGSFWRLVMWVSMWPLAAASGSRMSLSPLVMRLLVYRGSRDPGYKGKWAGTHGSPTLVRITEGYLLGLIYAMGYWRNP